MDGPTMPLLESLLAECGRAEDTVAVHINHCMENSFYFTRQLERVFHKVVFIAVPYNDRDVPNAAEYPVYHGTRAADGYRLLRNGILLERAGTDFPAAVRRMIALALQNDVQPYVEQGKRVLILEAVSYTHLDVYQRQDLTRVTNNIGARSAKPFLVLGAGIALYFLLAELIGLIFRLTEPKRRWFE